jgi:iron complex transport system ATP-binding protein
VSKDGRAVSVQGVSFAYGDEPVVREVTLDVAAGEFVGIIGPNGSGKTTLLRLLSKTLSPASGQIEIDGRPLARYSHRELARIMAFVPQETSVVFPFTALEVVLMGRSPYLGGLGFERDEDVAIAREAMRETDTAQFAGRYLHELSAGEKQRVIIARALAQQPRLLLLDEPTAFLDIRHELDIYDLLARLNRERRLTVLAVSHVLNTAALYCTRLVMLHEGRVHCMGQPAQVLTQQNIRQVYRAEVTVLRHPSTGAPVVLPEPGRST